jgi:hypothetical protein
MIFYFLKFDLYTIYFIKENSIEDIVLLMRSEIFTNNESTQQTPTKFSNINNDEINQEKLNKIQLLEEQKKYFKHNGQISNIHLLP